MQVGVGVLFLFIPVCYYLISSILYNIERPNKLFFVKYLRIVFNKDPQIFIL